MNRKLPGKTRLFAACCAFALALGMPFATAQSISYNTSDSTYLAVASVGDTVGVCNGDRQGLARAGHGPVETQIISYPVGTTIPRNPQTMTGFPGVQNVITAQNTFSLATLYHFFLASALTDTLHTESFSYAVQHHLEIFGRMHSLRPADGGSLATQMVEKARSLAGPYQFSGELTGQGRELTLSQLGVLSAAGNWFPTAEITLTISGPAQFADGTTRQQINTGEAGTAPDLRLRILDEGEVKVTARATNLPADTVQIYEMEKFQDLITVPKTTSSIETSFTYDATLESAAFTYTTEVSAPTITAGEPIFDTIKVTAPQWPTDLEGNPQGINLRANLYGPFTQPLTQTPEIPTDAQPVHSQLVTITGAGKYQTQPVTAGLEPGYYTWVVVAQHADQVEPARLAEELQHPFGMPDESFQVVAQPPVRDPEPPTPAPPAPEPPAPEPPTPAPPAPEPPAPQPPTPQITVTEQPPPTPTPPRTTKLPNTGPLDLLPLAGAAFSFGAGLLLLRPGKKEN